MPLHRPARTTLLLATAALAVACSTPTEKSCRITEMD